MRPPVDYSVSIACAVSAILCLAYVGGLKKDFFHPTYFYAFCQCVTLAISYLKISPTMTDFKPTTWFAWLGAMAAFFLGSFAYYLVCPRTVELDKKLVSENGRRYNWKLHFVLSIVFVLAYIAGAMVIVQTMGGFYLLSIGHKTLQTSVSAPTIASVIFASSPFVVATLMIASFKSINPHRMIRIVSFLLALGVIVFSVCVYPGRNALFLCLGVSFIMFHYLKRRIPVKVITLVIVLAISSFIGVGLLRSQYGSDSLEGVGLKYVMLLPYNYIANNYWNMDYAMNPPTDREIHPFTYGLDMAAAPIEYMRSATPMRTSYGWDNEFNKRIMKENGFNTVNYLWEVYKNFGIGGCVLFPFFVSFLMSFLYERMKIWCRPQMFVLMAISIYHVGWSFFAAGFKSGFVWIWVYIIVLMHLICSGRRPRRVPAPNVECAGEAQLPAELAKD